MEIKTGGITFAKGFKAAAAAAGIKYEGRDDMALICSQKPCVSAGVYTRNLVKAAPVIWDRDITDSESPVHAVIVNSGIANACTGEEGMEICRETAAAAARCLGIEQNQVLLASTGVIGRQLPLEKLKKGIEALSSGAEASAAAGERAAKAIMTTDTVKKEAAVEFELGGRTVRMGGMCKGSGMIHPDMCTMLGFITTDAAIDKKLLLKALREDVEDTFNMVSVDGDTSTNDSLIILANGEAGNTPVISEGEDYAVFKKALRYITESMSKMIAGDGEGATALFEVKVLEAESREQAKTLAKSVVCSSLTKAAIFGHDANWGRILCALGYSGARFDPDNMELYFESSEGRILIYKNGKAADYSEEEAKKILSASEVRAEVNIHMGTENAVAWGCDLSYDYVKINADYRS